eukprot:CAMPEP_0197520984 /NCGR_PEP_ID=MMETSP1318-20131121/6300_1 /TAXON_ID=552666 /ORGANISM="Partenskyella glossopodia, Strain RCC365" /LENGTH=33 /DNA_ID= /DNA_START= /DNA_END= /DNA_ORIENTATION=
MEPIEFPVLISSPPRRPAAEGIGEPPKIFLKSS